MDWLTLWNSLLVWPIEGALIQLTALTANAGIAIIVFTVLVRVVLLPLAIQQVRSQRAMMAMQPHIKELQRRWANDRQRLAQEQMRLYKETGVNPIAGCLPLVLQMPIWIALYSALFNLSHNVSSFQEAFLWIQNIGALPTLVPDNPATWPLLILPVLCGATQWAVQRMSTLPTADPQQQQMNRMMEFMPIMFLFFSLQVPAGLTLYWVTSNIFSIAQQRIMVGWGNLPFLGGSAAPLPEPPKDGASGAGTSPGPRTTPRPSSRRRKKR